MPVINPMRLMDAAMFYMESPETHMHMGGACIFRLPRGAGPDYVSRLYKNWCRYAVTRAPLNYRLAKSSIMRLRPAWEVLERVDLGQHFFHVALPRPGSDRELSALTERLHSTPLDRSRPLWEIHLIEGLSGNRFAMYTKIHHALADGVNATRMFMSVYSEDPAARAALPPWTSPRARRGRGPRAAARPGPTAGVPPASEALFRSLRQVYTQAAALVSLAPELRELGRTDAASPDTPLNRPITARRMTDSAMLDLARMRAIGAAVGGTINDVALAVCAGALRAYLEELGQLPRESLRCLVPVSLRREDDAAAGNTASAMSVTLATHIADPLKRLAAITAATRAGKESLHKSTSPAATTLHGLLLLLPLAVERSSGAFLLGRPPFNLVISNVPTVQHKLYMYGAELVRIVPNFLLSHGLALSILLTGYSDHLSVSVTACPDTLPSVGRLRALLEASFAALEAAVARRSRPRKRSPRVVPPRSRPKRRAQARRAGRS